MKKRAVGADLLMTDCCESVGLSPVCPIIDMPTKPVGVSTVVQHSMFADLPDTIFGFCDAPACDVVYVGADGTLIRKDQLHTRVGVKERSAPIPICYCFEFTENQIAEDLLRNGRSTIRAYIQQQVRVGRCRCELANPSGRCCLGNVSRVIASRIEIGKAREIRTAEKQQGSSGPAGGGAYPREQ